MNKMKKILNILQKFGVITGAVATRGGVFWYLDKIQDNVTKNTETLEYINIEQSMMSGQIYKLQDSLDDITDHNKKQDAHMIDMEGAARFYIRNQKQMTEDAMEDALETILKKNDQWSLFQNEYPIPTNNYWTTWSSSDDPWSMTYNLYPLTQ